MKAAVLAGGAGTRLSPLTAYVPKCLIPIGDKLAIDHVLDYLGRHEIRDIVLLVSNTDHQLFRNHLGNGERHGVKLTYSVAERIGTAGALHAAAEHFDETFVVYYGDVLTDLDLSDMIQFHKRNGASCTIALSRSVPIDYGIADVSSDGRVTRFREKPILRDYPVSMGVYVLEAGILRYCRPETQLTDDVIPSLIEQGERVYGYVTDRRHYDIGTFKNLEEARRVISKILPDLGRR